MYSKWYKYVLLSVIVLFGAYTSNISHGVAQESTQSKEVSGGEVDDLKNQLKQMEDLFLRQQGQMKQMQEAALIQHEQIQALKNRVDTVSAEVAAPVVTTPIAKEEIKHAVEDYLSTDEARKKMGLGLPHTVTAEYNPDDEKYALGFKSANGNYSLHLGGRMQFRYTYEDNDENFGGTDKQDLTLRRARVYIGGNIYSKLVHYYVEADADSFTIGMRDFYVYWTPLEELNAKIGYFKVPFNRQRMTTSGKLLLQDRSIASEAFDQDRDYGFDIYGKPFAGHMEYHAAVFQGNGEKNIKSNLDNKLMGVLSLRYNPFGKYDYYDETDVKYSDTLKATIGASVAFHGKVVDVKPSQTNVTVSTFDFGVKYRGVSWNNEYYVMNNDPQSGTPVNSNGFFTQLGYFILPKKLEIAARYSTIDPNIDVANDIRKEYTGGINYYFRAHRSKIQADFGDFVTSMGSSQDKKEKRIRLQYQIIF